MHLMYVLEQQIEREQFPARLAKVHRLHQGDAGARATPSSSARDPDRLPGKLLFRYGQNIFDRYVTYADYWIQDQEYRVTPTRARIFDRAALNAELEKIEEAAGIANPKDFRNEIVNFVLRARANNGSRTRCGPATKKLRTVIEKKMFSNTEELCRSSASTPRPAPMKSESTRTSSTAWSEGLHGQTSRLLCEWYLQCVSRPDRFECRREQARRHGPVGQSPRGSLGGTERGADNASNHRPPTGGQEQVRSATVTLSCVATRTRCVKAVQRAINGRSIRDDR